MVKRLSRIVIVAGVSMVFTTALSRAKASDDAPIVPVGGTASTTQAASKALENLWNGLGLHEKSPGSGVWVHGCNAYRDQGVERGTMWSSGYPGGKADTTPTVTFDLGKVRTIGSFRVWNYNETGWTGAGFKEVEILSSADGSDFRRLGAAVFELAPGDDDYEGQVISFRQAIQARYVRLKCKSNWRGSDTSGLSEIRFFAGGAGAKDAIAPDVPVTLPSRPRPGRPNPPRAALLGVENIVFPADSGIIDVTAAPYFAKGDGVSDDTRAIQAALRDNMKGGILYFPNGTYLVSTTLRWSKQNSLGEEFPAAKYGRPSAPGWTELHRRPRQSCSAATAPA